MKNYHRYLGTVEESSDAVGTTSLSKSGIISGNEQYTLKQAGNWPTSFGPPPDLTEALEILRTSLAGFDESDIDEPAICNEIRNLGFTVVMTPKYGACAESMVGATGLISSSGVFSLDEFNSTNALSVTGGFTVEDGLTDLNGHPYLCYAGFNAGAFYGIFVMVFTDYLAADNKRMADLFYPTATTSAVAPDPGIRNLKCFVLNADGTTFSDTTGLTSTVFSDGQFPGVNGYNTTLKFAQDDGTHGFREGTARIDGNGGPGLGGATATNSWGCENQNAGDTAASIFYWGPSTVSSTTFKFYAFVRSE